MLKLVGLLFLASLANAERVEYLNAQLDSTLSTWNVLLTRFGFGLNSLPDYKFPGCELRNGVHTGFNSLTRTGDATATLREDGSGTVDIHVGWHLFTFAYGSIKTQGLEYSGLMDVRNSSFHVSYDLVLKPHCRVIVNHFEFERLDDVSLIASNPAAEGDISDIFAKHVLPYFNNNLAFLKVLFQDQLQSLCDNRRSVNTVNHYSAMFNAMNNYLSTNNY